MLRKAQTLARTSSEPCKELCWTKGPWCNLAGTLLNLQEPCWKVAQILPEPCWSRARTLLEPCWSPASWNLAGTLLESHWNFAETLLDPGEPLLEHGETLLEPHGHFLFFGGGRAIKVAETVMLNLSGTLA